MGETRADTVQASVLAVGLHLLLAAALFIGLRQASERLPAAAGEPIQADMVDAGTLSAGTLAALAEPMEASTAPPAPLPAPEPSEATPPPPQPLPEPDPVPAPAPTVVLPPRPLPRPEPAIPPKPAIKPDPTPPKEPETAQQRRLSEQNLQRERREQAEAAKAREQEAARARQLAEIQQRRAALQRQAQLAEQRLQQLADARGASSASTGRTAASGPAGNRGEDDSLRARWVAAMVDAIERQWVRPDSVRAGVKCPIRIRIAPGGQVLAADVQPSCPYDAAAQRSVEAAVRKASPLPYRGFERVAVNDVVVRFEASP